MNSPLEVKEGCPVMELKPDAGLSEASRKALWRFAIFVGVLSLCYISPLVDLVRRTFETQLYSHILLIPFISVYLGWLRRGSLPTISRRSIALASVPFVVGLGALIGYGVARSRGYAFETDDALALTIGSYVCFIMAGALLTLGTALFRALAFPIGFLVFMIPFPTELAHRIEMFFQYTTASVSHVIFLISGTPVLRDETVFQLPGLVIRVAEECSGIRSSFVLFMTSLVAGCLFLRSPWKRTILAVAVIPLGILRNAVRVITISMLCIHVDPNIIHSPIHHRGGPFFFLLSLVPFFLLLHWLRKSELGPTPPAKIADSKPAAKADE